MHSPGRPTTRCLSRTRPRDALAAVLAVLAIGIAGCAQKFVTLRSAPHNPLGEELQLASWSGPRASARTMQLLRVYNLTDQLAGDTRQLLEKLQGYADQDPSDDKVYAMSELAYLGGVKVGKSDPRAALDLYGASVLYAYQYLFDDHLAATRNCYDPQFRGACDLYNSALESALRIVCKKRELLPETSKTIHTAAGSWDITCVLRGGAWRKEDFDHFEFVSDYEMKGLTNHYQTHGLGVPLIAVRRSYEGEPAAARHYPPHLSFPVTAFLRPLPEGKWGQAPFVQSTLRAVPANGASPHFPPGTLPITPTAGSHSGRNQGLLELYDPLATTDTAVGRAAVPLESDLTTPLAFFLSKVPLESLATVGLLRPEKLLSPTTERQTIITGLYMVQPYEPGKIPVLMVHGLWSSPMTWMEMFNDLRSSPDIRRHYQFWFYLYPTGQPFWLSAAQLRRDLAAVREVLDPQRREPSLDQMVLVGHSMGGLVSKLQALDSRNDFWNLASRMPLEQVKADPEVRQKLQETFYFQPNPSVRRVVTIATPHRGSTFSNQTTQYLLRKMIDLPKTLANTQQRLFLDNKGLLFAGSLLKIETSIDSLSPDCPILPAMLAGQRPPWVKYHNVVGEMPPKWWLGAWGTATDGVVSAASAHLEDKESEITVPADHTTVHCHPLAVMEVRRILHEHLAELRGEAAPAVAARQPGPFSLPAR
jgi:pimeloyl-ACP methyl ester carboxylesterase